MAAQPLPAPSVPVATPHFNRILVLIDFSDASLQALDRAIDLAKIFGASLVLAHITSYQTATVLSSLMDEGAPKEASDPQNDLDSLRKMIVERGVPCSILVRKGPVPVVLSGILAHEAVDLLVLAIHGKHDLNGSISGTEAEEIVRSVTVPVISISPACRRPWWDEKGPRHILFAGNFAPETLCGLSLALGFRQLSGAKLSVVEAVPFGSHRRAVRPARERIESLVPPGTGIYVLEGLIGDAVSKLALDLGAGLITLGVHRSSLFRDLFSTALFQILLTAPCPVLTIRQCDQRPD